MGTAHAIFVEVLPEVTWPEKPEVSSAHARLFPRFFSYYSSTKCDRQGYQKWRYETSPEGMEGVCGCTTRSCAISALVGPEGKWFTRREYETPFWQQTWKHEIYPSSSEGNRLRLYSSSSSEGNWLRLFSSSTAWSRVVIITTPDRNRGIVLYALDGRPIRVLNTQRKTSWLLHAMGPSIYQCDLWINRKWTIVFVRRFVHNIRHMMTPIPDRIMLCYGEYQMLYETVDGVDFQQGLPDLDKLDPREKHLIILDDLIDESDQRVASLFMKSHHRNISVMYIVQNLFHRGKHHRTISLNAHYMVFFKNPRDVSQIMALAHQMYPQRTEYFLEAYTAATAQPNGYLVIDMKQETLDILRLGSHIFPGEKEIAYAVI